MRIKHHNFGDERVRTFFAWIPVYCSETNETRWLERVTVRERFCARHEGVEWVVLLFL